MKKFIVFNDFENVYVNKIFTFWLMMAKNNQLTGFILFTHKNISKNYFHHYMMVMILIIRR